MPVPFGAIVRLSFDSVVRVEAPPFPKNTFPPDAPRLSVVAAPPMERFVAVESKRARVA